jgi:CYTH domain-containing protein
MPKEIEQRYLVEPAKLPKKLPPGNKLTQGYLCLGPVVRVRIKRKSGKEKAFLTIKGPGKRVREEFEYEIPVAHARQLMKLCGERVLQKTRYEIGKWEVDEYHGRHKGLWLCEIELPATSARPKELPAFVGREVTEDPRFTNANLVQLKGSFVEYSPALLKPPGKLRKSVVSETEIYL